MMKRNLTGGGRALPLFLALAVPLAIAPAEAAPASVAGPEAPAPAAILERVVLVMRHGVRSPTKPPETLSRYSASPWPAWPVAPGELTAHGATDVRLMGGWLRRVYTVDHLLPRSGCPAAGFVRVWSDGKDQRTRASGEALLDGAFPGCGLVAGHEPDGETDRLFDGIASGACPMDAEAARAAVLARLGGDLDQPGPGYAKARAALAAILGTSRALEGHDTLSIHGGELRLEGPLAIGATLSESLYLEWAQGMPAPSVGWGRAGSPAAIAAIMPMHALQADLMRRTPYIASHNGAPLARAVAAALEGPARFVAIVGHDTNIDNLAGILGLRWSLPGQPDWTPPGGALVFEVWRHPATSERTVRLAFVYQTLAELRDEAPLDRRGPAGRIELGIPGCETSPGGRCTTPRLESRVAAALPPDCRT